VCIVSVCVCVCMCFGLNWGRWGQRWVPHYLLCSDLICRVFDVICVYSVLFVECLQPCPFSSPEVLVLIVSCVACQDVDFGLNLTVKVDLPLRLLCTSTVKRALTVSECTDCEWSSTFTFTLGDFLFPSFFS
jgi:hypothetical protein